MLLQPCSPFDMGDFRVLATARRTRVRLRVAVQRKSPHLKRVRSADGSNLRRTCHAVGVRRVAQSAFTAYDTKLTFFVISAPIARLRCLPGVSGLAPIRLATAPAVIRAIRRVILRQAYPSLRSGVLAFLVLLASATVYLRTAFARLIQLDALHSRPASS